MTSQEFCNSAWGKLCEGTGGTVKREMAMASLPANTKGAGDTFEVLNCSTSEF